MKKSVFLAVALLLLATPVWANLLLDPSFESGTWGAWTQWKNANSAFSTTYALTGSYSMYIFGGGEHGVQQTVAVTPGVQHILTVNAMGNQNYVGWKFGTGGTQWEFGPVDHEYDEWHAATWYFTPTAATVTIYLDSEQSSEPGYWDDISLTAVPEPASVVAMLSGLIGTAAFAVRRRK